MRDKAQQRRDRLVRSAARRIHHHGYGRTSLADIAKSARVPVGGVYYYFKTKEDLVYAIVEMRLQELEERLSAMNALANAKVRLEALIDVWRDDSEVDARYGCPIGSLCYELAKAGGAVAEAAGRPLERIREWSEVQFREAGLANPEGLAEHLTMTLQGASLFANALRDPGAMVREADRLKRWIAGL
jgi:TetR/AcrR family transcriptional regulator, transcriptional repressor for nem operon